jgi:hypothetical protein
LVQFVNAGTYVGTAACPDERSSTDDPLAELQLITELRPRSAKTTPLYNPVFPESEK